MQTGKDYDFSSLTQGMFSKHWVPWGRELMWASSYNTEVVAIQENSTLKAFVSSPWICDCKLLCRGGSSSFSFIFRWWFICTSRCIQSNKYGLDCLPASPCSHLFAMLG
jgi:hypothetical protein